MSLLAIPFPEIDPVALRLGPIAVKWYGLAYMAGLLLGWLYIKYLLRQDRLWPGGKAPFDPQKTDDLLLYMTLGPMGLCYLTWFAALQRLPASTAALGTLTVPVMGVIAAALVLGEPLGAREVVAAALTLGGVALAIKR